MSFKPHAITDFSRLTEDEIGPTFTIIKNQLTLNAATFPALPVAMIVFGPQIVAYTDILGKDEYAGKAADLAAARLTVETSARKNGIYVNGIANGDLVILEKSGYPLAKPHVPVGPLAKSTLKVNSTENPGEFAFDIEGVTHERGFLLCYTENTDTEPNPALWKWHWSATKRGLLSGIASSTKYKLVSVGLGTDPALSFSDVIVRTTQ